MSYGIMPYRVSLSRLASRFSETNSTKKSRIRKLCRRYAQGIDDLGRDGEPTMMELVDEMFTGSAKHEKMGYMYWYALKGFIEDLGKSLYNHHWYSADADVFWKLPEFKLYDIDAPMKLPTPDDFPTVFVLRAENMTDALIGTLREKITDDEQFYQVQGWIREAKQYKQDLVLYYH